MTLKDAWEVENPSMYILFMTGIS